jgi:tRNA(Ile)-lysidine synthase TilS/MesJ
MHRREIEMTTNYRICTRCVMDTTIRKSTFSGDEGRRRLERIAQKIKSDGANKEYDCIICVSGGVDSTYALLKVKQLGLRPLAFHLDNGWNSELSEDNIQKVVQKFDVDLYTHVLDWEEFEDLQLSFLRASTPDSEIPTDHAIGASMIEMTDKIGVPYIFAGANARTESHLPREWSQGHMDWKYIKSVSSQ